MRQISEYTSNALEDRLLIADDKEQLMLCCASLCQHECLCMNKLSKQKYLDYKR